MTKLLQANNIAANTNTTENCEYLEKAVSSWLDGAVFTEAGGSSFNAGRPNTPLLWAQLLPVRCSWQSQDGVITQCDNSSSTMISACEIWTRTSAMQPNQTSPQDFATLLGLRSGSIFEDEQCGNNEKCPTVLNDTTFRVKAVYDEGNTTSLT